MESSAVGTLRLRAPGSVSGDDLSAGGNVVWGSGKGHGCKGRLARHLQKGANEAMRIDELMVRGMATKRDRS